MYLALQCLLAGPLEFVFGSDYLVILANSNVGSGQRPLTASIYLCNDIQKKF